MTTTHGAASPMPAAPLGRDFLVVWAGQTVSTVGSTVGGVGAAVWVYVTTGSAAWLGALTALAAAPAVLGATFSVVADRVDRRRVMIGADVVAAVGPLLALVLALLGRLEPWHLALAGFVGGIGTAVQVPAYQAALPHLVAPGALGRANGLVQLGPAAGIVLGPAIATPLVAVWGVEAVLLVDLVSFAIGVTATVRTKFTARAPRTEAHGGWAGGARWLAGPGRSLLALLVVLACVNLVLSFFNVAAVAAAVTTGGAARAGLVPAAGGTAMVAVSLVVGARGVPRRRSRALAIALGGMAVGSIVAAGPTFAWLLVGVPMALAVVPIANAVVATSFHERVPGDLQGRVFGIRTAVGRALDPIGAACAGVVIARLAAPAISADGALAGTLGRVVGTGPDRATSVVLVGVGVCLAVLAVVVRTRPSLASLDDAVADGSADDVARPELVAVADAG